MSIFETSVGFRSCSRSRQSARTPQVTEPINPAVGCRYFTSDPRLLAGSKLCCLVTDRGTCVCKQLAQGCTRQRGGRDSTSVRTIRQRDPCWSTWSGVEQTPVSPECCCTTYLRGEQVRSCSTASMRSTLIAGARAYRF